METSLPLTDSQEQWSCSCDIEIIFPGISFDVLMQLAKKIPMTGYCVEDKSDRGWGCVIVRAQCWDGDRRKLSSLIVDFVSPLRPLIQEAAKYIDAAMKIRLGVYYDTYTLTLPFDRQAIECLNDIYAELEISGYPST